MVVTGTGPDVGAAQDAARRRARNVIAPELRWRGDIGDRFVREDGARLARLGWIDGGIGSGLPPSGHDEAASGVPSQAQSNEP
jgi:hypothetical protein